MIPIIGESKSENGWHGMQRRHVMENGGGEWRGLGNEMMIHAHMCVAISSLQSQFSQIDDMTKCVRNKADSKRVSKSTD